jgi:hypothetical protein
MKKAELFPLFHALNAVASYPGAKFGYAVAKNLAKVKEECVIIEKLQEPSEEFKAYDAKRIELCKKWAKKDEDGEPVIIGNEYDLKENMEKFKPESAALAEEYKETLDARRKVMEDVNTLLQEESDIVLHKIKEENLPEVITGEQVMGIMAMIEDNEKETTK